MVGMYIYEGTTWKDLEYPRIFSIRDTVCTDVDGVYSGVHLGGSSQSV